MKKLILASAAAVALFGVAACSDTDNTTTQSVEPPVQTVPAPSDPAMAPAPAPVAPSNDDGDAAIKPVPAPSE
jgi:hypothetical protein